MNKPRYDVVVKLIGTDGNVFALIAKVRRALKRVGVPTENLEEFFKEATAGDYNHALRTTMDWVHVI